MEFLILSELFLRLFSIVLEFFTHKREKTLIASLERFDQRLKQLEKTKET